MKPHRPFGLAPTKLEADILKIRAFEMVLILFYVEDLKQFIIGSLESSFPHSPLIPPLPQKGKMEAARKILVAEGCITQADSDEIFRLMEYRNTVGHHIHSLTCDIGAYSELGDFDPKTFVPIQKYDYSAAKSAAQLRKSVSAGMTKKFALTLSFNGLRFEAAERVYLTEIKRLKSKVNTGIDGFNQSIAQTNAIIRKIPPAVFNQAQPGHPRHIRNNGTLSESGAGCLFQLYDAGATPLAASYLMRISVRSANSWRKKWEQAKALE